MPTDKQTQAAERLKKFASNSLAGIDIVGEVLSVWKYPKGHPQWQRVVIRQMAQDIMYALTATGQAQEAQPAAYRNVIDHTYISPTHYNQIISGKSMYQPLYASPTIPEGYAKIYVGHGEFALCDWDDWPLVRGYWWHMSTKRKNAVRYAQSHSSHDTKTRTRVTMHGLIMKPMQGQVVDHINGNGLDNRRENLRVVTMRENSWNQQVQNRSSQFKGVSYRKDNNSWRAYISKDGKRINLGNFTNEEDAARAYNKAAIENFGEYARLNDVG